MPQIFVLPRQVALDDDANPLAGALLYFFKTNTTEPQAVYSDAELTTEHSNPVPADSGGKFPKIYLNPNAPVTYRVRLTTSSGTQLYQEDDVDHFTLSQNEVARALYPQSTAEDAVGAVIASFQYPYGHVYRYGENSIPGTTDMSDAINMAADVCRQGGYTLLLPEETCLVAESLDFSQITVMGCDDSGFSGPHIRANSSQFHVITSVGNSTFENFYVHGGWDGSTAGQDGDVFHFDATGANPSNVAYNIHLKSVRVGFAKKRSVYWYKGGYGSIQSCAMNNSGLHVVELEGTVGVQCTTIQITGKSTLSDAPNGDALKMTECVSILCNGVIMENTNGISIHSSGNRAISLIDVYQEGTDGNFISGASSSGVGLTIAGCFGGVVGMEDLANWQDVHIYGNGNLTPFAVPLAGRVSEVTGSELTTATTGGVNVTATSLDLGIGTWKVFGEVQIGDAGSLSASLSAACRLTTNVADSGLANATNANFEVGADRRTTSGNSERMKVYKVIRLTAAATVYLRANFNFAAGTLAYKGHLYAELLQ